MFTVRSSLSSPSVLITREIILHLTSHSGFFFVLSLVLLQNVLDFAYQADDFGGFGPKKHSISSAPLKLHLSCSMKCWEEERFATLRHSIELAHNSRPVNVFYSVCSNER